MDWDFLSDWSWESAIEGLQWADDSSDEDWPEDLWED